MATMRKAVDETPLEASRTSDSGGFSGRALTSTLVAFSFAVLAVTGILLYLEPPPVEAHKRAFVGTHITLSFVVVAAALAHLWFNWRALLGHFSRRRAARRRRWEWVAALAITTVTVVGTVANVPPFSLLVPQHGHGRPGGPPPAQGAAAERGERPDAPPDAPPPDLD